MSSYDRLLQLLRERSFKHSPAHQFELSSGRMSDFFIDVKQAVLSAEGHFLVGNVLLDTLRDFPLHDAVAGVELGGCSLVSAVSYASYLRGRPIDALYVRKRAKAHGSKRAIEGAATSRRVVIVEDVATTGASAIDALRALEAAGHVVVGVLALVDRREGAREALAEEGHALIAPYNRYDFIPT